MATPIERARAGSRRKRDVEALSVDQLAARKVREAWAAEHLPDFHPRLVLWALAWAERRPGAPDPITPELVRAEIDRIGAEPTAKASA